MFFKKAVNYILGYVNIKVESYYLERFINMCTNKKIFLYNIKREKSTILYASVTVQEYKRLRKIAKITKSKISIQKRKGIPFVLNKYRHRKTWIILLCIVIVVLVVMSNFIWNIDISGNQEINTEEIMQMLQENGLEPGKLKQKINTNEIISNIRLKRDDIAWIGIKIKGTNAIVQIKEKSRAPEIIDKNEYCNIIADKTGMITKLNVQNGTANVKSGDIVKTGDILVKGFIEGKYTGIRYVHAKAEIEAKVWYSKKEKVNLLQTAVKQTGNSENKYSIKINNFKINLYKTLSKFQKYDTISTNKKIRLFSNFYLPIEIIKTTNYETTEETVTYTEEEIIDITNRKLEKEIENQIPNDKDVINKQYNVYKSDGYMEVEVIYEILESIGSNEKIVF